MSAAGQPRRLLLVDGSSYLYRAYHAMPDLRAVPGDPQSQATGAIRGIYNMLEVLKRDWPADYAAVVFDAPGKTFRDALYPEYKANRSPMPDDLRSQIGLIHEMVVLMGWPVLCVAGVEADDVLATLAQQAADQRMQVVISSGDKDLAQLVNAQVMVVDTMSGKRRDEAGVLAEFGVAPSRLLDYQTLVGDSVDHVPGVEKVGPKTAVKWLQQYGDLATIVAHAEDIGGVVGQNLRKAIPWLATAQQVLKLRSDCDLAAHVQGFPALDALAFSREKDAQTQVALLAFSQRMGFASLAKKLQSQPQRAEAKTAHENNASTLAAPTPELTGPRVSTSESLLASAHTASGGLVPQSPMRSYRVRTVLSAEDLAHVLQHAGQASALAMLPVFEHHHLFSMRLCGVALAYDDQAVWLPLWLTTQDDGDLLADTHSPTQWRAFSAWLEQQSWICHDAKTVQHLLANHGSALDFAQVQDVQLQSYVLAAHHAHSLERMAERILGCSRVSLEELRGKGAKAISLAELDAEVLSQWATQGAQAVLQLHAALMPALAQDPKLTAIYRLELATSASLWQMERHGVRIDPVSLQRQSADLGARIQQLESEAHQLAGQAFNLGSPKQIGEIFFKVLQYPILKKTPKGEPSTDEEVLEKLAEDYPLPACILQHRGLAKLRNTYTDKLGQLILPSTGRVHTHYAQTVAVTGRLSSLEPNLQNIPIRTAEGRRIRTAFIPTAGWQMLSADYSQIELRIMAHISQDAALLKAFRSDNDIHRATAAEILGLTPAEVSQEQRRHAKVINFGLIYGMSAFGLAKALNVEVSAAKHYMMRYFERYPGVQRYMEATRALARAQGYVQTVFGRRLTLPEINSPNGPRRAAAERAAINAPMQGTAADLIKMAMNAVHAWLKAEGLQSRMLLQVHDELVFEAPTTEVDLLRTQIPVLMAGVAQLDVPLIADIGVGNNWDEAH